MRLSETIWCLPLLLLTSATATGTTRVDASLIVPRQGSEPVDESPATLDDSCNVGFCSIYGAAIGGWGGNKSIVSTLDDFAAAVSAPGSAVIVLDAQLTGNSTVSIGSGKTVVGAPGSSLTGVGLVIGGSRNVIVRNFKISGVLAAHGAAITIANSSNVWVDHCDLSSDLDHGEDHYADLLDIAHGADYTTVTYNLFHNHFQASLVGLSDQDSQENSEKLHVTFANNHWLNVRSSAPSYRFGTGHVFNSVFQNVSNGISTGMGANLLVESSVFEGSGKAIYSADGTGSVTAVDVVLGDSSNTAPKGNMTVESLPYPYDVMGSKTVKDRIVGQAGQTLKYTEGSFDESISA